jgi:hypothetical protein
MSCDIHIYQEKKVDGKYEGKRSDFLDYQSYGLFGFLANVRNYSAITPISKRRGIPIDSPFYEKLQSMYYHSGSWLSIEELLSYDYEQIIEDRRCTIDHDGGRTCEPGKGEKMALRKFLGKQYFDDLQGLKESKTDRIVFCFDC